MNAVYGFKKRHVAFYDHMVQFHEGHNTKGSGHDLIHDLMVSGYAVRISETEFPSNERLAELVWIAGMLHSTDRFFGEDVAHRTFLENMLTEAGLTDPADRADVMTAILEHGRPNQQSDGLITVVLKDADRLANINPLVIIRSTQFHPGLPTHDPQHLACSRSPGSTYKNPNSVMDDIFGCTEWETWLRTDAAKKIGKKYFAFLRKTFKLVAAAHRESFVSV
jgi:hypothetical protein